MHPRSAPPPAPTPAGPNDRAGLTEDPEKGIPARCTATRVREIAAGACRAPLDPAAMTVHTKTAVRRTSITIAVPRSWYPVAVAATASRLPATTQTTSDAT